MNWAAFQTERSLEELGKRKAEGVEEEVTLAKG